MPRRPSGLVAVVALVALLAAGCRLDRPETGNAAAPAKVLVPHRGGSVSYGIESDPNGLDPTRNAWDPAALLVGNALFDTWVAFDDQGVARPNLALSFEHNADYTRWKMNLRPGVRLSDGTPYEFDADNTHIKAILTSLVTAQAAVQITVARRLSALSAEVEMSKPWAAFPAILTGQPGMGMAPSQVLDPEGSLHPLGTGPFKLARWDIGTRIELVRNEFYWRKDAAGVQLPYLDRVNFEVVADGASRLARLRDGSLDIMRAPNFNETRVLDALPKEAGIEVMRDPGPGETTSVMFNTAKPPLDDVRVRRALAHATDRRALAATGGWPDARLADSVFAADSPWYTDSRFPGYDPDKARALIRDYEAEKGPVVIRLTGAFEPEVTQEIQEQWEAVGAQTELEVIDFKKKVVVAVAGGYDAILFRYFAATDPDTLWHFWTSATLRPVGQISLNFSRLTTPQIDADIDKGRASDVLSERKAAYADLQHQFADLVPYVWLHHNEAAVARRSTVHDAFSVTLPDGSTAAPFDAGVHRLSETWVDG